MIARVRSYLRRDREQRSLRALTDAECDAITEALAEEEEQALLLHGVSKCRGCGKWAQVELTCGEMLSESLQSNRVEYLCYEDLGTCLELFADPGVREWTVVRL